MTSTTIDSAVKTTIPAQPTFDIGWVPTADGKRHIGTVPSAHNPFPQVLVSTVCPTAIQPIVADTDDHLPCEACLMGLLALTDSAFPEEDGE